MAAVGGRSTQAFGLLVKRGIPGANTSQLYGLAVYAPPQSEFVRESQTFGLATRTAGVNSLPRNSQLYGLLVYSTHPPTESRQRAWTFTLDGHTFYVLDLGQEGTFLYDDSTQQWCKFITNGFDQWNFANGTMWGTSRIVGGDLLASQVWEMSPTAVLDEGFRDINHVVTGGLATRSRVFLACDAVRLTASFGQLDEVNGTTMTMRFSDDNEQTWSDDFILTLTEGDYEGELAWRSLGSFMAPGRVFEFSDVGGLIRIDGADAFVDGFDQDNTKGQDLEGGQ